MKSFSSDQKKLLSVSLFIMLVILIIQFLSGMYVNLFVEVSKSGSEMQRIAGNGMLLFHFITGLILILCSIALVIVSIAVKSATLITLSIVGVAGIVFSYLCGIFFIKAPAEIISFFMALGFALSFIIYALELFLSGIWKTEN